MRQRCVRENTAQLSRLPQLGAELRDFVAHKRIDRLAKLLARFVEERASLSAPG
jgi:hypothetical protein